MTEYHPPSDHLQAAQVAGYVNGGLSSSERQRIEHHLADCMDCTAELVAVDRLHRRTRNPARWLAGGVAAAAAVIGVLLFAPGPGRGPGSGMPVVRGSNSAWEVRVVLPGEGTVVQGAPTFIWRPVAGATAYRVSVSGSAGDSVWAATTRDTNLQAGGAVWRAGPSRYYWYVDVLLADGRSLAGEAHEFGVAP